MRLGLVTHRRADPSFRIRWERHREALREEGIQTTVCELSAGGTWPRDCDAIVLHRTLLSRLRLAMLRRKAPRLIYDFDDALYYRPHPPHRSRRRARRFFRIVERSDLVLAGNGRLARLARLRNDHVRVVPSAVDVESYAPVPKCSRFTAVWIGQRATLAHLEPVRAAVLDAGIALRVIADHAPPGVEFVRWAEDDETRRLAECHVGMMPLPDDPFARGKCGYKLLQYYAAGLPAVVAPVGVNRALAAGGALLAEDPVAFVAALTRLRDDANLRDDLGRKGRAFVARRYAAGPLAQRLARILKH